MLKNYNPVFSKELVRVFLSLKSTLNSKFGLTKWSGILFKFFQHMLKELYTAYNIQILLYIKFSKFVLKET